MRTFAETSTQARGPIRAKTSGNARRRLQGGDASRRRGMGVRVWCGSPEKVALCVSSCWGPLKRARVLTQHHEARRAS